MPTWISWRSTRPRARSSQHHYSLWDERIKSSHARKDSEKLWDENLDMNHQHALAAQKSNHILGFIKRSMTSRSSKMIFPLFSALVRSHPQHCAQLWDLLHKNVVMLEQVQERSLEMIRGLKHLPYKERPRELELCSQADLIAAQQYLKRPYRKYRKWL